MQRIFIGTTIVLSAALLTGWTGSKILPEQNKQPKSSPMTGLMGSKGDVPSERDLRDLQSTMDEAAQKRRAILKRLEELGPEAEAFMSTFEDNQSIALSAPELDLQFAGKDWVGRGDTKRMDIQIRLANPSKDRTIKSVVLRIDIYQQGSDVPVVKNSRWLASSFLGLEPSTAAVRSITPISEDPFTRSGLRELNDRKIHLVVRPLEIRYQADRVALQINRPGEKLADLEAREKALMEEIRSLETEVARLETGIDGGEQVASQNPSSLLLGR